MARNFPAQEEVAADASQLKALLIALGRQRSLRDPLASTCEQMQFTPPQLHTLLWLGEDGALTMGELARRLGVTEKTVTGVVDRLEREAYVQRERDTADRRVVRCRLTDRGAQTYAELDSHLQEKLQRMLGLLDPADRTQLFTILQKLGTRLAELLQLAPCPAAEPAEDGGAEP
ncbi:MarR family transcriptional regulator [Aggregicoccus sp. 17bor-14]|uniref:MarR family winged helix-turn-helix transcriptional regulator n=1 Tax=Myxococcaceae TaxID=31 RepID=UPI0012F0B45A|nr:MarR family transcriptional regulator [Simulacricoccus sp. 17bor-14]MRI87572.1 MarR family transcriptional regulator [Aggregicoccus sp. 17bor-14]